MKCNLQEYGAVFCASFEAETKEDAALLVRMGMNATKKVNWVGASVYQDGTVTASVNVVKRKQPDSTVPKVR